MSRILGHSADGGIQSMKNPIYPIGNQTWAKIVYLEQVFLDTARATEVTSVNKLTVL